MQITKLNFEECGLCGKELLMTSCVKELIFQLDGMK